MTNDDDKPRIAWARMAGFMYLFVIATYLLAMFISMRLQVPGNFPETARRIIGSEALYRFGLSCNLIAALSTVLLAMGLYVIVKPIDNNLALLALLFRMVEATLTGVSLIFGFVLLRLYRGGDTINAFDANQLPAFVTLRSAAGTASYNIGATFFGMGSILFFYLFLKSSYIPRILSALGFYGSLLVPIMCIASLIWPQYAKTLQYGWIPIGLAEVAVGIWLLARGVNGRPQE